MLFLLTDELRHDLVCGHVSARGAKQRILQALQGCLRLTRFLLCKLHLLRIVVVNLFDPHLVICISADLALGLERLDLHDSLVTVFVDLVHRFNHPCQVSAFHTKLFLELHIDLLENDTLSSQLINLLPQRIVLSHGCAVPLVGLVQSVLDYLSLLG